MSRIIFILALLLSSIGKSLGRGLGSAITNLGVRKVNFKAVRGRSRQASSSSSSYHDVLPASNDEQEEVRSLAVSSKAEHAFFEETEDALLRGHDMDPQVIDCNVVSAAKPRPLVFWENMVCGAISRSVAQTLLHPMNTMKTILQSSRGPDRPTIASLIQPSSYKRLTMGAGANFILSVPHGAVNFAVLELVRDRMNTLVEGTPWLRKRAARLGPGLDFMSSCVSTICCSVVSTPQMMVVDNIMAGNYPTLTTAVSGIYKARGVPGFYEGWFPGLAGKIPSYALTWTMFQQFKVAHRRAFQRAPTNVENSVMGCVASATCVCIMIPVDTIKTRLVTQTSMSAVAAAGIVPYKGIVDCAVRMLREEGAATFYRGLPPRLISVVPMIGIQFGVYEAMKKVMRERSVREKRHQKMRALQKQAEDATKTAFAEATMEVAADNLQPFPAPQFQKQGDLRKKRKKSKNTK